MMKPETIRKNQYAKLQKYVSKALGSSQAISQAYWFYSEHLKNCEVCYEKPGKCKEELKLMRRSSKLSWKAFQWSSTLLTFNPNPLEKQPLGKRK